MSRVPREVLVAKEGPGPGTYEDCLDEKLSKQYVHPALVDKKLGFGSKVERKTDANFIIEDKLETAKERKTVKNVERGAYELVEAYEVFIPDDLDDPESR